MFCKILNNKLVQCLDKEGALHEGLNLTEVAWIIGLMDLSIIIIINTQIAAIALPPSTTHPQLWAKLLTFETKCTIA